MEKYEHIFFVGRQEIVKKFTQIYSEKSGKKVMYLIGSGGVGKTKILQQIEEQCKSMNIIYIPIVDLYNTSFQTVYNFMAHIINAFGEQNFPDFFKARDEFYSLREQTKDKHILDAAVHKLRRDVATSFDKFSQKNKPVLLLDTFERVQDGDLGDFLLNDFLPYVNNCTFVIAGRLGVNWSRLADQVLTVDINMLSLDETALFFKQQNIDFPYEEITNLWVLTEGKPIRLALTVDWLHQNVDISNISRYSPIEFEDALVSHIRDLDAPIEQVILLQAHVFHRFSSRMLSFIYGWDDIYINGLWDSMKQLSFMRYLPNSKSCILHDEMRDMVVKYVWDKIDMSRETRTYISNKMIEYYKSEILNTTNEREKQVLESEKLYHEIYSNRQKGLDLMNALFETALSEAKYGYCDHLIRETERFFDDFDVAQKAFLAIKKARNAYRTEELGKAKSIITKVLAYPSLPQGLRLEAQTTLDGIENLEERLL